MKPTLEERADALDEFFGSMDDQEIVSAYSGLDLEVPCEGGVLKGAFIVYDDGHFTVLDPEGYEPYQLRDYVLLAMNNFINYSYYEETQHE